MLTELFGAKAKIYLKYHGDIDELAKIISKGMLLPEFVIERSEYPPYELFGSCEAMGFEIWLKGANKIPEFMYTLKLETELCTEEIFNNRMYDLSFWLARYVSKICETESIVFPDDTDSSKILFVNGEMIIR